MNVFASTFADTADVAAFHRAKARGLTDREAFAYGDNGVGAWGADTSDPVECICALPPEDIAHKFGSLAHGHGARVRVTIGDRSVDGVVGDLMPHKGNIRNGCGIDLNPGFQHAFGIRAPFKLPATWEWLTMLALFALFACSCADTGAGAAADRAFRSRVSSVSLGGEVSDPATGLTARGNATVGLRDPSKDGP